VVIEGFLSPSEVVSVSEAYDAAVLSAAGEDIRRGRTNTRVSNLFNYGPQFDRIFAAEPVLAACNALFPREYRLSSLLARTLHPGTEAQDLHVDYEARRSNATIEWVMVGFILMVDSFTAANGATVFVPGSHRAHDRDEIREQPVPATGQAGSLLLYNGSVWHGHGANRSSSPRRSIQGAYIRRDDLAPTLSADRVKPATFDRLSPLARYLLGLPEA
jgi:ectoine hydroxylase-related dioxygenase (phytanoyl-CoA dioxygenase family)